MSLTAMASSRWSHRVRTSAWLYCRRRAKKRSWSTGLAPNPLVASISDIKKDPKTHSLITNDHLEALDIDGKPIPEILAIGDAAMAEGTSLPATAQVANQKVRLRTFFWEEVFNTLYRLRMRSPS